MGIKKLQEGIEIDLQNIHRVGLRANPERANQRPNSAHANILTTAGWLRILLIVHLRKLLLGQRIAQEGIFHQTTPAIMKFSNRSRPWHLLGFAATGKRLIHSKVLGTEKFIGTEKDIFAVPLQKPQINLIGEIQLHAARILHKQRIRHLLELI